MIAHFVETTDGLLYGKFLVCRLDPKELATPTAMPEANGERLLTYSGRRRFNDHSTLIVDLQRGVAIAWPLERGEIGFRHYMSHKLGGRFEHLVCPMYLSFVEWLHLQGKWANGTGLIKEIPNYIDFREQTKASAP